MSSLGSRYWQQRLARWPGRRATTDGYTLLVPVPGDLPVFLDLSLRACAHQDHAGRRATIVIPDRMTPAVRRLVDERRSSWPGPLLLRPLPPPERWFLPALRSGSRNHGMQLYAGVAASRTTHVILHDADLFPVRTDLHERQYASCRERGLDCLGVSGVWDPWYARHGLRLAATWELCASVEWIRSFPPSEHIGHDGELFAERHTFDTTLSPQARTDPARIDHGDLDKEIVHFNYVITSYRLFQRHGPGYLDDRFRLLLVSLVTDLLGGGPAAPGLPCVDDLAAGLTADEPVVRYSRPEDGAAAYGEFRAKLDGLLDADWLPPAGRDRVAAGIAAFDRHYGYTSPHDRAAT